MPDQDLTQDLIAEVNAAVEQRQALQIKAGDSKHFYIHEVSHNDDIQLLDVSRHAGIVDYEPSELYITARCGTPLKLIEETLAAHNQMLAFEPPAFADSATIGGTVACGLSGPRRPYAGACRDAMLGADIINGLGQHLSFGGQVMKNVAGYDVARAMCGAQGTLGVIVQVSLKVMPMPEQETTVCIECDLTTALNRLRALSQTSIPVSASYFEADSLYLRLALSGSELASFLAAHDADIIEQQEFWTSVKEHQNNFFMLAQALWRCSLPMATAALDINGSLACEWNGGLHWYKSNDDSAKIIAAATQAGGHARLFRHPKHDSQSGMAPAMMALHTRIKHAFDPYRLLNPGQLYPEL